MNQAELHHLLVTKDRTKSKEDQFDIRLYTNLGLIQEFFFSLYPEELHLAQFKKLVHKLSKLFSIRPDFLKEQDLKRVSDVNWYKSQEIVGMQLYVDLFNKDLQGLQNRLDYFKELGVNFLHLMPITTRPKNENDGGYAVNSHTEIDATYGTREDLELLTEELRSRKMYLMLDFVANHTSDEHEWARAAKDGNSKYQKYYYTYTDRTIPNAFERSLPEVFPETSPGNFTYIPEMEKWVMTVFNSYQWDLNYRNPEVFLEMLENLVALSNMGADVIRLDALAFLWKKMNTTSQNLPEAHTLVTLFRLCLQVVAPGSILLAEAIVAPEEIIKYFGEGNREGNECEAAYNASLMALLWNSIATKKTALLYKSLFNMPIKPLPATWINYIRCHDDIGLGLSDQFIQELGWNPRAHRQFLLDYYCQHLEWSPAKGLMFMYNPKTGDGRISGSAASLLGLEKAMGDKDKESIKKAVDKIVMLHGIILAYGGIPMIYAGDEIGTLNDYSFLEEKDKKGDNRWVNRPKKNWDLVDTLQYKNNVQGVIFNRLRELIATRKETTAFTDSNNLVVHHSTNPHLFVFERPDGHNTGILIIANFDERTHPLDALLIKQLGYSKANVVFDLVSDKRKSFRKGYLNIAPYQLFWLKKMD
ncbi:MAG: alpha-amylase family glycosyl hydrolase [Bacteroidota bacterium]